MNKTMGGIAALAIGLIAGLAAMFIYQVITPFLEIQYLKMFFLDSNVENIQLLQDSALINGFYLVSLITTILIASYVTLKFSSNKSVIFPLISGGIFYLVLLVNPVLIETNIVLYILFVVLGALAVLLPVWITNDRDRKPGSALDIQ